MFKAIVQGDGFYVFVVQGDGFLCFRKGIFSMVNERLKKQLDFILEVDKTKIFLKKSDT